MKKTELKKVLIMEKKEQTNEKTTSGFRTNLYEHIQIPLKTMDTLITTIVVAIVVLTAFGIWQAYIG